MHRAAAAGDTDVLATCLAADASLAALPCSNGLLPIHYAAQNFQLGAVEALLAAGAGSGLDSEGRSAIHHLCAPFAKYREPGVLARTDAILGRLLDGGAGGCNPTPHPAWRLT